MTTPDHSNTLDDIALDWATRLDGGALPPAEQAELEAWLAQNPAHAWRLAHYRQFVAELHGTIPAVAAERQAALDALRTRRHRRLRAVAGGLAAAAAVMFGAVWFHTRPNELVTQTAQRQSVALADGSRVDVNARTTLTLDLSRGGRVVRLRQGEAFFSVARDEAKPFLVETPAGTVRVTGTKFNVRVDESAALQVTVLEGSVAVRPSDGEEQRLKPHDQLALESGAIALRALSAARAEDAIAWRDGKVVFDETPLREALARFAPYHQRRVTLAPALRDLPLGGRYTLDDFEQFLASLEETQVVRVERLPGGEVRILPRR